MHIRPKKKLGQNFLLDKNIQRKIISACAFGPDETVLEIGAGRGELSGLIAEKVKLLYAVEMDRRLCAIAEENLKSYHNIKIIDKDILKLDFKKYFKGAKIKVVGNIPYYICSPIIEYLLQFRSAINQILLTVQKEFARRMVAAPGSKEYGSFSCFVQYYALPEIIFNIKKNSFFPVPKVDSSLVRLKVRSQPAVRVKDEGLFFKIIRGAFNKRRKTLKNSLQGILLQQELDRFFFRHSINSKIRPERLSLSDFAGLCNIRGT